MELGGKVTIECEKTGYRSELEFKLKVNLQLCRILLLVEVAVNNKEKCVEEKYSHKTAS